MLTRPKLNLGEYILAIYAQNKCCDQRKWLIFGSLSHVFLAEGEEVCVGMPCLLPSIPAVVLNLSRYFIVERSGTAS